MTQYAKIAHLYTNEQRMMRPIRKLYYQIWIRELNRDLHGIKALDLGCGGGDGSRVLALRGVKVIGIDLEPKMIRIAEEKEEQNPLGIQYFVFNIEENFRKIFGYHKFDLVTSIFSLHYCETKKALEKIIRGIASSLKVGGRFIGVCSYISEEKYIIKPFEKKDPELQIEFVEGAEIKVSYYDADGVLFSFSNVFWKPETYSEIFEKFGFRNIQWTKIKKGVPARVLTAEYRP